MTIGAAAFTILVLFVFATGVIAGFQVVLLGLRKNAQAMLAREVPCMVCGLSPPKPLTHSSPDFAQQLRACQEAFFATEEAERRRVVDAMPPALQRAFVDIIAIPLWDLGPVSAPKKA